MIERYFIKHETQDRIRASWLGKPIERYVTWLHEHQYAVRNVHKRVPVLMRFAAYAQSRGAKVWTDLPDHVQPFVERWVCERGTRCRNERARKGVASCVRSPIEQMLRLLLPDYVGSGRGQRPHPFIEQAPDFFDYLQEERGLSSRTVEYYDYCLRSLQTYLKDIGVSVVKELSPTILSAFVTARGQEWGKSAMTVLCAALRVFLSYLHREGLIRRDLSSSVEAPKRYRFGP
jgi:integrase/recombinase XerD